MRAQRVSTAAYASPLSPGQGEGGEGSETAEERETERERRKIIITRFQGVDHPLSKTNPEVVHFCEKFESSLAIHERRKLWSKEGHQQKITEKPTLEAAILRRHSNCSAAAWADVSKECCPRVKMAFFENNNKKKEEKEKSMSELAGGK